MPEYLAPGVYVEETSFRSRSIEGVSTTTTGFVGATRYGPIEGEPELITSFSQFERIYGGLDPLEYEGNSRPNYLAHAVRGFFDNGGARLYVVRAYEPTATEAPVEETPAEERLRLGIASAPIPVAIPELEQTQAATTVAISTVQTALSQGIVALEQAREAGILVLQLAVASVLADLDTTMAPVLDYNYEDPADAIGVQLNAFITGELDGDELTNTTTNQAVWQITINQADVRLQAANAALTAAEAAETTISAAYENGADAGEAASLPDRLVDTASLTTDANDVTAASNVVTAAAAALEALAETLATDLEAASDPTTTDPLTAAEGPIQALINGATSVMTASVADDDNAASKITVAATTITLESRVAAANTDTNATADWLARFPGRAGNQTIFVTGRLGANVLSSDLDNNPIVAQMRSGDLVVIVRSETEALIYSANRSAMGEWSFVSAANSTLALDNLTPSDHQILPLTLTVEVQMSGKFVQPQLWDGLTVSDQPNRVRDSVTQVFAEIISNNLQRLETPSVLQTRNEAILPAAAIAANLIGLGDWSNRLISGARFQLNTFTLTNGNDGNEPEPIFYRGFGDDSTPVKSGLRSLEDLEEISIVAAPGYSHTWNDERRPKILAISQNIITHCEIMRYRVAALDSPDNQSLSGVREYRALLDTTYAALYYPWIRINDPVSERVISLPPSGFVTGIYARNDIQIGVHKAPANEVVRGAIGLETLINKGQQDVLNPLGINCIRFFEGRGIRVWGARTISSDPEWKYLNIRRYFVYLEASIDRSTQWAVFEPNGERLWANIRRTVESFLETEWREGRLAGASLEEAFFVRCDRSTMTQNDIDNGRMICLIGVAPLYPAEFVIFRIGQWTADRR